MPNPTTWFFGLQQKADEVADKLVISFLLQLKQKELFITYCMSD